MFQEADDTQAQSLDFRNDSEPHTPAFQNQNLILKLQVEELQKQNSILKEQCHSSMIEFRLNSNLQVVLQHLQSELKEQIQKTQLLTLQSMQKHEKCFSLNEQLSKSTRLRGVNYPGKRITTCPSDTSTVPSPSFVIPSTPKLRKVNCKSFSKNILI